jgi:hypothetical protein
MQLISSEEIRIELRRRADSLVKMLREFESVLEKKNTRRLLLSVVNNCVSFQLLKENNLLYRIAQTFGIHAAVATMLNVTEIGKNCNDLGELMKQIEVNTNHSMQEFFLKYYGFLLPPRMKAYGERLLTDERKLRRTSYEKVTELQLYLYSYLAHMPLDENVMAMLNGSLKDHEIINLLMALHVLNRGDDTGPYSVEIILNSPPYHRKLSKKDKRLLMDLS